MGQRVDCSVEFEGEDSKGTCLLEPDSLMFRGDFKLNIPLKQIESIEAKKGQLKVTFPKGTAIFHVGPHAEKWALKIRYPKGLMAKLGVKPESRVLILGINDESFIDQVKQLTSEVFFKRRKDADLVFLSAESKADLKKIASLENLIKRDGAIWVVAPKGKQHIKESDVLAAGKAEDLVDIKVVSFSDTHTAHKLVIPTARR